MRGKGGYTLLELMVACGVFALVFGMVVMGVKQMGYMGERVVQGSDQVGACVAFWDQFDYELAEALEVEVFEDGVKFLSYPYGGDEVGVIEYGLKDDGIYKKLVVQGREKEVKLGLKAEDLREKLAFMKRKKGF